MNDTAQLIKRILAGEKDDFRHLVVAYQDRIYGLLMRQIGDPAIARDLAQDVFVRAYRHLSSFRGDADFGTWITRIALNVANSWFASRSYKERARSESLDLERYKETAHESPAHELDEQEAAALREAVSTLKPVYREVIALCSFEGKSYRDAAAVLNVPLGTVCSRMNKALNLLRAIITGR